MPDGGRVAIVMGPIEKANGERRRQGIIDELLDRSFGPGRPTEPIDEVMIGEHFTIAATLIDNIDPIAAQANVKAALESDPEIDSIIGIFAYSTPAALAGVKEANAQNRVTLIAFDDRDETLAAVAAGEVFATLVQDQYNYGYHAIKLLARASDDKGYLAIPITEQIHFPLLPVTSENIDAFMASRPIASPSK
jgi:ribose transport system substrate-binding protein